MNLLIASQKTLLTASRVNRVLAKMHTKPRLIAKHSIIADNIDNELRCRARGWSNATGMSA